MAEQELSHAERVERLMEQWNCLIEELKRASRHAPPGKTKPYDEAIGSLIALREATRRGLVQIEESESFLPTETALPSLEGTESSGEREESRTNL